MWHTGKFFLIQDERASSASGPFDTLSILGVDARNGGYVARAFENHGFYHHCDVAVDGNVWTFIGETECARHGVASANDRTPIAVGAHEWR